MLLNSMSNLSLLVKFYVAGLSIWSIGFRHSEEILHWIPRMYKRASWALLAIRDEHKFAQIVIAVRRPDK